MPNIHPAPDTTTADEILRHAAGVWTMRPGPHLPVIRKHDMQSLIDAFPCLRRKDLVWLPDEDRLPFQRRARANCYSHGEALCAEFVMHVWDRSRRFRFGDAMNVWGGGELAAFQAWCLDPWYR
jgi:hypothetical protein